MSIKLLPLHEINKLSGADRQIHTIAVMHSIDETLKKLLYWAIPSGISEDQFKHHPNYKKQFGDDLVFDSAKLAKIAGQTPTQLLEVEEENDGPLTPVAQKPVPKKAAVAKGHAIPAMETTLGNAPIRTSQPSKISPEIKIISKDDLRAAASDFIMKRTAAGGNGKEEFGNILRKISGFNTLSNLPVDKYGEVMKEIKPEGVAEIDPLD